MTTHRAFIRALFILGCLLFIAPVTSRAQSPVPTKRPLPKGITVTAGVTSEKVILGDQFQYIIEVTGNASIDAWKDPDLLKLKGMRVRSGPDQEQTMSIVNGRSQIVSRHSYTLEATEIGQFKIPAAQVKMDGVYFDTDEVIVTVTDVPKLAGDLGSIISARTQQPEINRQLQGKYFARADIPEKLFRGQAIPVKIYIYRTQSLPSFTQWQIMPDQNDGDDFVRPNVRDPQMTSQQLAWESVKYGDQDFQRALLYTMYIVPTKTGKLRFTPPTLQVELPVVQKGNRSNDVFDMMMGNRGVVANLSMRSADLAVENAPDPPPGALLQVIGRADVKVKTDRLELPQRELLTLKMTVTGNGFFDLLTQPKAPELAGLTLIDTKSDSRMDIIKGVLLAEKNFEYIYQAAAAGAVEIPSFSFGIFNPAEGASDSQGVVKSPPITVNVTASTANAIQIGGTSASAAPSGSQQTARADAKTVGKDVSYIDPRPLTAAAAGTIPMFYLQPWFWLIQIIPFGGSLLYGLSAVMRRNHRGESSEERMRKGRRAAAQSLKETRAKLSNATRDEFYATLSNGIMTFIASLLGRSAQGLTADDALAQLTARGYRGDALSSLASLLRMCDTIRYSPAPDTPEARQQALVDAETLLTNLTPGAKS